LSADHREPVQRALAFIAENLHRAITLQEVAKVAGISPFYFHRIFGAVMGETVGEFITRQRLETAALMLAYHPGKSVTEIGYATGYSSTANFSKAFSAYFGVRPSDLRKPLLRSRGKIGKLLRKHGKDFAPADLYVLPAPANEAERERRIAELDASVRFEEREEMPVACLASPRGYDVATVEKTWNELIARARRAGLCGDPIDAHGIVHESPQLTAPELCRYYACVPIDEGATVPRPLFRDVIPGGRYAVFRFAAPVAELEATYRAIYSLWFPASGLEPHDFRPIERYVNDAPKDGAIDMEIWIRLRPKGKKRDA